MNMSDITRFDPFCSLRQRIVGIDQRVPVLGGVQQRYINLDNAASTPVLREVLDTVNQFMEWYCVGAPRHRLQEPRGDASLRGCARDRGGLRRRRSA